MSDNLSLISKDHNTIVVESKVALASPVIWETVEMYEKAGRKCEFIPLPCKGEALRRIMTWIEYHQSRVKVLDGPDRQIRVWEELFFSTVSDVLLFDIIEAANHLRITQLVTHAGAKVNERIGGLSPQQCKEYFSKNVTLD